MSNLANKPPLGRKVEREADVKALRQAVLYNPETGVLLWKARPVGHFKSARAQTLWNARFAGRRAFNHLRADGYRCGLFNRKTFFAHRVAWFLSYGEWPSDQIDHINRNKSDQRLSNLRAATAQQNACNRVYQSATGFRGVTKRASGKYQAICGPRGKRKSLGDFATPEEAARAYDAEARKVFGEFAVLNFEDEACR